MPPSRRDVLRTLAAFGAAALWPAAGARAEPADLAPESALPVYDLDVAASNAAGHVVPKGLSGLPQGPTGLVLRIPPTRVRANVDWLLRRGLGHQPGVRLILRGQPGPDGTLPVLEGWVEGKDTTQGQLRGGLDIENLVIDAGERPQDAVSVAFLGWVGLRNVRITGGRNGLKISSAPTRLRLEGCEVHRSAGESPYNHNVYINYIDQVEVIGSRFLAPRSESNCFKCYAARLRLDGCTFANWWSEEDRRLGFVGGQALVEIGTWGDSVVTGNTFVRRSPCKPHVIDYRNRLWEKGHDPYVPDWGVAAVDYHRIDNRGIDNRGETSPQLFRHYLGGNRFLNGVLPGGGLDQGVKDQPGWALHHNGTCTGWTIGLDGRTYLGDRMGPTPDDWDPRFERAIVYTHANTVEGVPFTAFADNHPALHPDDLAPVREIAIRPPWAEGSRPG